MDIDEAMDILSGLITEYSPEFSTEELKRLEEAEALVYEFIKNHKEEK
jgi:hypothetical protein